MRKDKGAYKILVIEDNDGDYGLVENFLTEQISEPVIVRARTFKQAAEILASGRLIFDVLLLDLSLPDKSNNDLVREMLRIVAVVPIIILTGYTDIDFSIRSIRQGISDYLLKDELNATLLYKSIVYSIERMKSIWQVANSEKRYSDLFQLSPQPMWVFDPESFMFVHVNKATITLYGFGEKEFLRMSLMDIKIEEDVPGAKEIIRTQKAEDGVVRRIFQHRKKSGQVIDVEIYSSPIMIGDKKLVSVIAVDVTEKILGHQNMIKAIIKAQEDERYEIGSELHDNVCQILVTSQLYLGLFKESIASARTDLYDLCRSNLKQALEEIRNLSHRLAPAFFSDSTIEEDFARLFETFNAEKKSEISLHLDQAVRDYPMSPEMRLNLYRILQEQLRNIQKYANATMIEVDVLIHRDRLKMRVSDNGVGFDVKSVKRGIGFANMKRRAELFTGEFEITSLPGNGCEIIVDIPLIER